MNLKDYQAGQKKAQYQYQSFMPSLISTHDWFIDDPAIIQLLSETDLKLGELNAYAQLAPEIETYSKLLIIKESLASCRTAGDQVNFDDILRKFDDVPAQQRHGWQEIHNYINALTYAFTAIEKLPISTRLINDTHKILMQEHLDKNQSVGEFRTIQNWVGGASINDALYIPPHNADLPELMADLDHFLNEESYPLPRLVRIAIAHYQFEAIYPYVDGNGRLGRVLILLYLLQKKVLHRPILPLSVFFEKHKSLYFDNLMRVRSHNDLGQWIKFFLEGVRQTAENSIKTINELILLRKEFEMAIHSLGKRAKLGQNFFNYLFKVPVVSGPETASAMSVTLATSLRLIEDFVRLGILREITGGKRNRMFVFSKYIQLVE